MPYTASAFHPEHHQTHFHGHWLSVVVFQLSFLLQHYFLCAAKDQQYTFILAASLDFVLLGHIGQNLDFSWFLPSSAQHGFIQNAVSCCSQLGFKTQICSLSELLIFKKHLTNALQVVPFVLMAGGFFFPKSAPKPKLLLHNIKLWELLFFLLCVCCFPFFKQLIFSQLCWHPMGVFSMLHWYHVAKLSSICS